MLGSQRVRPCELFDFHPFVQWPSIIFRNSISVSKYSTKKSSNREPRTLKNSPCSLFFIALDCPGFTVRKMCVCFVSFLLWVFSTNGQSHLNMWLQRKIILVKKTTPMCCAPDIDHISSLPFIMFFKATTHVLCVQESLIFIFFIGQEVSFFNLFCCSISISISFSLGCWCCRTRVAF